MTATPDDAFHAEAGGLTPLAAVELQDDLLTVGNDLDRLQALLADASETLLASFHGAHTQLHCSLAARSEHEQYGEIVGSKQRLEQLLGRPVDRFAYPFGTVHDYNATSLRICEEAGFRHAAANRAGIVHKDSPRFAFPRVLVRDWSAEELAAQLRPFDL